MKIKICKDLITLKSLLIKFSRKALTLLRKIYSRYLQDFDHFSLQRFNCYLIARGVKFEIWWSIHGNKIIHVGFTLTTYFYFVPFHSMLGAYAILVTILYGNSVQYCIGFSNIEWLTESFTCSDNVKLEVELAAG